jgi:hypothetical protein
MGTYCKHRLSLLNGTTDDVVGENAGRISEVLAWLPGTRLEASLAEVRIAEEAVQSAKRTEARAKRKLAAVMIGRDGEPSEIAAKEPEVADEIDKSISNDLSTKVTSRGRHPLKSIDFSDSKKEIRGYARNWYFWVHTAFYDALDIRITESIDKEKTAALRDKMSIELFGMTHFDLKKSIERSGKKLSDSKEHKKIMSFSVSDGGILTESATPQYEFRVTDGLESRSGIWYVQVDQTAETDGAPGSIGFKLYSRLALSDEDGACWEMKAWLSTSQREFVELLRSGRCATIDLDNPPDFARAVKSASGEMAVAAGRLADTPSL